MTFKSGKFTNFYFNTADWFTLMEENSGISLCKNPVLGGQGDLNAHVHWFSKWGTWPTADHSTAAGTVQQIKLILGSIFSYLKRKYILKIFRANTRVSRSNNGLNKIRYV